MNRLTDADFDRLIAEVEQDIVNLAKSQDASKKLEKASPEDVMEEDNKPAADMVSEAEAEEAMQEAADTDDASADMEAKDDAKPEMEDHQGDDFAEEEMDLDSIYSSMSEEELKEHYEAIRRAMEAQWSREAEGQQEAPEKEAVDKPEEEMQMAEKACKEEKEEAKEEEKEEAKEEAKEEEVEKSSVLDAESKKANGGEIKAGDAMAKAEQEKVELQKKLEEMTKSQNELQAALEKLIKTASSGLPVRKAVTEIETKPVEPELSKDQLKKKALEITSLPLTKSERDVLNAWFIDGKNESEVKELIKAKKA